MRNELILVFFICLTLRADHSFVRLGAELLTGPDLIFAEEIRRKLDKGSYGKIEGLIIKKADRILFQKFPGNPVPQCMQSVTKSVVSLIVGIAIKQGHIKSTGEKISNFFPEYKHRMKAGWKSITIEDILTMNTGIEWNEDLRPECMNPVFNMYMAEDIFGYIFEQEIIRNRTFNYSSANVALLSMVIYKATGMPVSQYAGKFLFGPLKIYDYKWSTYRNHFDNTSGGLYLAPMDILKIGELYLHKGKWQGQQIVDEEWIKRSFTPRFLLKGYLDVNAYGYLWWINTRKCTDQKDEFITMYLANGYNNNHLILIPKHELLIVTTGIASIGAENYVKLINDALCFCNRAKRQDQRERRPNYKAKKTVPVIFSGMHPSPGL